MILASECCIAAAPERLPQHAMRTLLACALATASAAVPAFPLQFVATVETTAHLVDKSKPYPPWKKRIRLAYDYLNKRARADRRSFDRSRTPAGTAFASRPRRGGVLHLYHLRLPHRDPPR